VRSPAYDVLDLFQISGAEVGQMFDYRAENIDDPRRAICDWMIDNFDVLEKMIPRNYPRTLEKDSSPLYYPLSISALFFASLAVGMAIFACFFTFIQRNKLVIKHAQIEFLCIILAGLFLVSCGALMTALPPTNGLCLGAIWTTNVGFSLELVPLIVKMAAFYRLIRAARRMRHVKLTLRSLFGAVILLTLIVVGFLIAWSLVDPPRKVSSSQ
jgi:7 transmembrane sweet-taste receptor of 3 GCPR